VEYRSRGLAARVRLCGYWRRHRVRLRSPVHSEFVFADYLNDDSGLTVANRLSENPAVTVAVLEVGSNVEDLPEVRNPIIFLGLADRRV
jgi:hypothetical protein